MALYNKTIQEKGTIKIHFIRSFVTKVHAAYFIPKHINYPGKILVCLLEVTCFCFCLLRT